MNIFATCGDPMVQECISKMTGKELGTFLVDYGNNRERRYIMDGPLMKRQKRIKRMPLHHVFLFSDVVLITEAPSNDKYLLKRYISLDHITVKNVPQKQGACWCLDIMVRDRVSTFCSDSEDTKNVWIQAFTKAILEHRKQSQPPGEDHSDLEHRVVLGTIHAAALAGSTSEVEQMLTHSSQDIDARDDNGCTAAHIAGVRGDLDMLTLLVRHHADLKTRDKNGWTPLHGAAANGKAEVIQVLAENGCDLCSIDNDGRTPTLLAAVLAQPESAARSTLHRLTMAGAPVDCRTADVRSEPLRGCTALHLAVLLGEVQAVRRLLWAGADPNLRTLDTQGKTALHIACTKNDPDIIELLLAAGAFVNLPDSLGLRPLDLARELSVLQLLVSFGARGWETVGETLKPNRMEFAKRQLNGGVAFPALPFDRLELPRWSRKPPRYMEDAETSACIMCCADFTTMNRRHHCRCCGAVVCGDCSTKKLPLLEVMTVSGPQPLSMRKSERVCDPCFHLVCCCDIEGETRDQSSSADTTSPSVGSFSQSASSSFLQGDASPRQDMQISGADKSVPVLKSQSSARDQLFGDRAGRSTSTSPMRAAPSQEVQNVVAQTKDKLLERGEKLKMLQSRTSQLTNDAQSFADMARQLREQQEKRRF
eukprot:GILK01006762.1.p1 GENE.GILK01006762.1~~GILK01006762.1.p1  ORF type:complete len:650 (-),score=76.13 GILK01006762.1:132-2081(-)